MKATLEQRCDNDVHARVGEIGQPNSDKLIYMLKMNPSPALQKLGNSLSGERSGTVPAYVDYPDYDYHDDTHSDND